MMYGYTLIMMIIQMILPQLSSNNFFSPPPPPRNFVQQQFPSTIFSIPFFTLIFEEQKFPILALRQCQLCSTEEKEMPTGLMPTAQAKLSSIKCLTSIKKLLFNPNRLTDLSP